MVSTWLGRTTDGTYGLIIEEQVVQDLHHMCSTAGEIETGGVLIGRYSADLTVAIAQEATSPPADSRRGSSWFSRGVVGLREMLRLRWRSKERTYYMGEWHYHPAATIEPSTTDIAQMQLIRDDPKYSCAEPVLLIVGKRLNSGERPARAFVFPRSAHSMELIPVPDEPLVCGRCGEPYWPPAPTHENCVDDAPMSVAVARAQSMGVTERD